MMIPLISELQFWYYVTVLDGGGVDDGSFGRDRHTFVHPETGVDPNAVYLERVVQ